MTWLPLKARSELVWPTNCWEGGVFDTSRRFQIAWPASIIPGRRPTRGSGFGASADMSPRGDGPPSELEEVERAHATADNNPAASESDRS
jgi:hypothetical protein